MTLTTFQSKIFIGFKGVVLLLLGVFFLVRPERAAESLLFYIGLMLLAAGIITLFRFIRLGKSLHTSSNLYLWSISLICSGLFLIFFAKYALIFFAFVAGFLVISDGISLLRLSGFNGRIGRLLTLFGVLSLLLGIIILLNPSSLIVFLTICFGIVLILSGAFLLIISLNLPRKY